MVKKYTEKEKEIINKWLKQVGASSWIQADDLLEFRHGQLLEIAKTENSCLSMWDEWQLLQNLVKTEMSLTLSRQISSLLFENEISLTELHSI